MKTRTLRAKNGVKRAAHTARHATGTRAKETRTKGHAPESKVPQRKPTRKASAVTTKPQALAKPRLEIPPILLEGDEPRPLVTGPGEKYALGPGPAAGPRGHDMGELPEAYGTGRLLLVARDPHWLYAHWDLMPQQQRQYNALSTDRHLVVRVRPGAIVGHPVAEVHVHPESRSWFIHVERPGTSYSADLGFYTKHREWVTVASSAPAVAPSDTVSRHKTLRFATIPPEVPLRRLARTAKLPLQAEAPPPGTAPGLGLTEAILSQLTPQASASSMEITEVMRGPGEGKISPLPPVVPIPLGAPMEGISSPAGGEVQPPRGFQLTLNAELILYGTTEPNASLTISGQPVALRPDGTFSLCFALPDGDYAVTVSALSIQGDCRQATLKFSRRTDHQGEVGTAPPDPSLNPPPAGSP